MMQQVLACRPHHFAQPSTRAGVIISDRGRGPVLLAPRPRSAHTVAARAASAIIDVTSEEDFNRILAETALPVVIDCSATWCGPCKHFEPTYKMFAEAYHEQAVFLSVIGDANESNGQLMTRLEVRAYPHFFVFKDGKQVASWNGTNKTGFRKMLAQFIKIY